MITKVIMPKLGETMEEGNLIKWLKQEGDKVEKGEILFEIETDKAVFTYESTKAGLLRKIVIPASDKPVPVLITVGYIADSMDEEIPAETVSAPATAAAPEAPAQTQTASVPAADSAPAGTRKFISPLARRMAREMHLDINALTGSGPNGRILARDIKASMPSGSVPTGPVLQARIKEMSKINKIVGERLTLSKTTIPHFYMFQTINMSEVAKLREALKTILAEKRDIKVTVTDIIIKALTTALIKFPELNAHWKNNALHIAGAVHIGMAVASGDELLVPVLKNVQNKTLLDIARERAALITAIKEKKITPDKLSGGTFTLSNLGNIGLESFTAIINPPEVAIMAVGGINREAVVKDNQIVAADVMKVSISCDHRAVNGIYGAQFLMYFKDLLESPYLCSREVSDVKTI